MSQGPCAQDDSGGQLPAAADAKSQSEALRGSWLLQVLENSDVLESEDPA